MITGVNIISGKVTPETPAELLRKFLGSKEHLNWLKIDLNAVEIITIQDCKHAQN